eukprot:1161875-Pelagomonas_calceolata.AAC.16
MFAFRWQYTGAQAREAGLPRRFSGCEVDLQKPPLRLGLGFDSSRVANSTIGAGPCTCPACRGCVLLLCCKAAARVPFEEGFPLVLPGFFEEANRSDAAGRPRLTRF